MHGGEIYKPHLIKYSNVFLYWSIKYSEQHWSIQQHMALGIKSLWTAIVTVSKKQPPKHWYFSIKKQILKSLMVVKLEPRLLWAKVGKGVVKGSEWVFLEIVLSSTTRYSAETFLFFSFIFDHTHNLWKFPSQGWNSCNQSHSSDNTISLPHILSHKGTPSWDFLQKLSRQLHNV